MGYDDIMKMFKKLRMSKAEHTVTFLPLTTGEVDAKELFTVTGEVIACVIAVCETLLTIQVGATIQLGVSDETDAMIAATAGDAIDAGDLWMDVTPETHYKESDLIPQWLWISGVDIGYEVLVDTIDTGVIKFICLWKPVSSDGKVVAAGVDVDL